MTRLATSPIEGSLGFFGQPLVGRDEKTAGSDSRVGDREVGGLTRVRPQAANDALDQDARREELPGPFFPSLAAFSRSPS